MVGPVGQKRRRMNQLSAFHGQQDVKDKYIKRVRKHREADELIRGAGWDGHRGCAVACTLDAYNHAAYETELGIPSQIAYLEYQLIERLPLSVAMEWPERFLSSIEPGKNLDLVTAHWFVWLLVDPKDGVIQFAKRDRSETAIRNVAGLYQRQIDGQNVTSEEFRRAATADASAASSADAAYAAGAYAAAAAYAADAAAYAAA